LVQFRLLGSLEIDTGSGGVAVGPPKHGVVLASLLLTPGQPVPPEVLIDRLWGEAPPNAARESLYAYIARLRRILRDAAGGRGDARLVRGAGGYLIDVDPDRVDLHRFRRFVDQARGAQTAGDDDQAVRLLRQALDLWRGEAVAGLPGDWAARLRDGLAQQRVAAMAQLAAVELGRGRHAEIVDDLAGWSAEYPLAEPLAAHLMLALYRAGRGAEALAVYERTRQYLADALGNDPGPQLRLLHQQILRQDAQILGQEPATVEPARPAAPAQLPADIAAFTGRAEQLRRLDALVPADHGARTVVITAIGGTAGVGKTALAVHWAHRVADRFPDGQLYVDLRGFGPGGTAMSPAEAIRGFLDALDVPPQRIPRDLAGQAALYRSMLAGRRVLVVLDNARDADQVRPLLPGSPGCLAVVTSRNQLSGLVAAEGAHPLALDLLTVAEARTMLAARLGGDRVSAEPEAVDEIVERCERLPLALAVVAARAAAHPDFPLAALAAELRDARGRLDALSGDDSTTDVRAVFSWSYRMLSPEAGRLFRLLSAHPGPDFTVAAAASLAGAPRSQARSLVAELTRAQLVREHAPGRYLCHDLLRAYATELAHQHDPDDERRAALRRILDHYLHTAGAANQVLHPHQDTVALGAAQPGVTPTELADQAGASAWFTAEHQVLLAAVQTAADHRFDTHAWQLAWFLSRHFRRHGHWQDWVFCQRTALAAARRTGDQVGQAHTHRGLGAAYGVLGQYEEAHQHLQHAADLFDALGDRSFLAQTHLDRGRIYSRQSRYAEALHHGERALDLFRADHDRRGQASALNNIGWYHAQLGDHQQTLVYCRQAVAIHQQIGDQRGEADAWDSVGFAHHRLGQHRQAITCYQRALDLYRRSSYRIDVAEILDHLGDAQQAAGDNEAAHQSWSQALDILDELGEPEAETVRRKLKA
jgi:DNA-binding SARP family transcriptional activator/tetratricopeptide (TPR) repeat protein